jgi:hypothetical protein
MDHPLIMSQTTKLGGSGVFYRQIRQTTTVHLTFYIAAVPQQGWDSVKLFPESERGNDYVDPDRCSEEPDPVTGLATSRSFSADPTPSP